MRKVADADGVLLLDVGEVGALVVDLEVEDSMLVGESERNAVDGSIVSGAGESQVEAMEGGKHGKLELENVVFRKGKGNPLVPAVLGQRDGIRLDGNKRQPRCDTLQLEIMCKLTTSFLIR